MTIHDDLIREIILFLKVHQMAPSRFGRDSVGDPKFYFELMKKKRSPQIKTVERVRKFMAARKSPKP